MFAITWGDNKFVGAGESGRGAYSTDGVTWTAIGDMKFGTTPIRAVAYGGGRFVAAGNGGKGAYSTDGVTWTPFTTTTSGLTNNITAIIYADGKFVAVNDDLWCLYSPDGINWTGIDLQPESDNILWGIAYGSGRFVVVGEGGKGFYSPLSNILAQLVFSNDGVVRWVKM
jgi:hypothetical protein